MAGESWAFDTDGPTIGGALAFELPPNQQKLGPEWPNPAGNVSDHSAEGAPWTPTADNAEAQAGWAWQATGSELGQAEYLGRHDGPSVPYDAAGRDSYYGQTMAPQPGWNHDGADDVTWRYSDDWGPHGTEGQTFELVQIGAPFTINQGSAEARGLKTDVWTPEGFRVLPPESASAPHELYGSEHYTRPRLTPSEHDALFTWAWAEGQQFPRNKPEWWGVQANEPDMSPRPQGAVLAQMPDDPYVAQSVPGPVSPGYPSYDLGF